MQYIKPVLLLTIAIITVYSFFPACEEEKPMPKDEVFLPGDTININYQEILVNYQNNLSISWDSVLNDSRCPLDRNCKWPGNAELRMNFKANNKENRFILNTYGKDGYKSDTLIERYRIKLIMLTPYPETSGKIPQQNYSAKIIINKE